ncbi:MAG TPA: metallophosphoesterase [Thermoanaerobaculia bacterium]|nr:metallophosphoesterase [Thermoanaerobaculia bacterium]
MNALATHSVTARLIAIGDIHGCYDELVELLDRVDPSPRDVVVSVGDMVRKGPAAALCLGLWRERGYLAVRGNNEITLLAHARPILRFFAHEDRDVLRKRRLLELIRAWPLAIDFANVNVAIVHGGFLPDMAVTEEDIARERDVVPELRWIRKRNGRWKPVPKEKKRKSDRLWSDVWDGERFVVYGHTPLREPRVNDHALGLDTGCVYGGKLTAAILENGEWSFVSVKARRAYAK